MNEERACYLKLQELRGKGGGVRATLAYLEKKGSSRRAKYQAQPAIRATSTVQATAFVRLQVNNEPIEVTYAEANRLWEELGKVFVRQ